MSVIIPSPEQSQYDGTDELFSRECMLLPRSQTAVLKQGFTTVSAVQCSCTITADIIVIIVTWWYSIKTHGLSVKRSGPRSYLADVLSINGESWAWPACVPAHRTPLMNGVSRHSILHVGVVSLNGYQYQTNHDNRIFMVINTIQLACSLVSVRSPSRHTESLLTRSFPVVRLCSGDRWRNHCLHRTVRLLHLCGRRVFANHFGLSACKPSSHVAS